MRQKETEKVDEIEWKRDKFYGIMDERDEEKKYKKRKLIRENARKRVDEKEWKRENIIRDEQK